MVYILVLAPTSARLIALRCAGYNNDDLKAALGKMHVVRVPAYSPHAVAEYSGALMLCLNRLPILRSSSALDLSNIIHR